MNALPPNLVRFRGELEDAIRADRATASLRRRRAAIRVSVAGIAVAAVALGSLGVVSRHAPSAVGSASAESTVRHARAALATTPGTVLHVDMLGTRQDAGGGTTSWEYEGWQQESAPFDRRQIETAPGGATTETATENGLDQLYDAQTNTIHVASRPGVQAGATPALALPSEFRSQTLALLDSGAAHTAGHATIDGRDTLEIGSADGNTTYYVDPSTYAPVELVTRQPDGSTTSLLFRTYEEVPASAGNSLVSLTAQHPSATVDHDPAG